MYKRYPIAGGAAEWGSISGDINNQLDLMSLLDDKVTIGGDSIGADLTIGTHDAFNLNLEAGGVTRIVLNASSAALHVPDSTSTVPSALTIRGGNNSGGVGGALTLSAGASDSASTGAALIVSSGGNSGAGAAGTLTVQGGQGSGVGNGGLLILKGGRASGGGTPGAINLRTGTSASGTTYLTLTGAGLWQMNTSAFMMGGNSLTLNNSGNTFGVSLGVNSSLGANYSILFPAAAPGSNTYLYYNGTNYVWQSASGSGDVVGPASSTALALAVYADTTGKLLQDSAITNPSSGVLRFAFSNGRGLEWGTGGMSVKYNSGDTSLELYTGGSASLKVQSGGIQVTGNGYVSMGSTGQFRTDNTAVATTLGTVARRMPIYNSSGTLLGYLPIYDTIT
jgi:hypothetical protein